MRRMIPALALIAALALPAGTGAAAKRPLMTVGHPFAKPAQVDAGKNFRTTVRVRNRGRAAGATRLIIRLRRRGVRHGVALRFLAPIRPHRSRVFRLRSHVPAGVAPRAYVLEACVRRRGLRGRNVCRRSARPFLVTDPSGPPQLNPTPGSRTAGDVLFPEIGNGGYNAARYAINLRYDPAANAFLTGTSTAMTARATKDLSQFSMDFEGLLVTGVTVAGEPAAFRRVAPAACSASPPAVPPCGKTKLVVTPAQALADDDLFTVRVSYVGVPREHTDPDESIEGWIRACSGSGAATCDGAFVVNQPIGAMTWFPSNNHPADKARFETAVNVPSTHKAIGVGELEPLVAHSNGTTTWRWTEDDPTSTYLTTATVGRFNLTTTSMNEDASARALPVYMAVDRGCSPLQTAALGETPAIINFFNDYYGAYPLDSTGAVVDRAEGVGYALEVQTKPHYPGCASAARPTIVHELAHQWLGNAVTLATWSDIWFNEGWAQWSDWFHSAPETATPQVAETEFQSNYDNPLNDWSIAPAVLDGDPANLFAPFPTYTRGAMTLEGFRQILEGAHGDDLRFFEFARELVTRFRYGNVGTRQVIDLALEISDFTGADAARLAAYFEQWLYGSARPTITPATF